VPTAPEILPTAIPSRARCRRSRPRAISAQWLASARPKVIGSAWIPCERPIIGVRRCSSIRRRSAASSVSVRVISASAASRSRIASELSSTSLEVIPRCSHRAGAPASSSTWVKNAITSWRVVASIASIRAGSSLPANGRTCAAVPAGTTPARSIASHAASSTSSHVR
jgi:hypothetical protein